MTHLLTLLIVLSFLFAGLASGKLVGSTENVERDDLQRGGRVPDLVRVPDPIDDLRAASVDFDPDNEGQLRAWFKEGIIEKMKDTSYLVDDDMTFGEMRQNSMIAEAASSEFAFDTGGDRKLQTWCPNSCSPMNARGVASSLTLTIEFIPAGLCFSLACNCNGSYKCRDNVGCKFCCGNFCWKFNHLGNPNFCCRIDGVDTFSNNCFNARQLCGS